MKTKVLFFILVMQMLVALPVVAQGLFINDIVAKPLKASMLDAKDGDTINDYQEERQLIDNYLKQINSGFSVGKLKVITGLVNDKHLRFNVIYKQIPVDGYTLTLYSLSDTTLLITGANLFSNDIETTPVLTKEEATEKLKLRDNRINDSTILSNRLIIFKDLETEPYLCYKMEVLIDPFEHYYYYVSAMNGEIIFNEILSRWFTSATGTANLHNWGTKNILTSYNSSTNSFFLFNQPCNIQTYDLNLSISPTDTFNIIDLNNNWTFAEFPEYTTYSMNAALVCHWGAYKAYDFFKTKFDLDGYDGNNGKLNICTNYGGEREGYKASWIYSKNSIVIGSGVENGNRATPHFGVVDIVAHEFGHAVTDYNRKDSLGYYGECGAVQEGLSDIWAACVENYLGASPDEIWNIGDHRGYVIRNMANPNDVDTAKTYPQPDTYGGIYWRNPADLSFDNGGIHINSGVLNYWFYLLTMGGSGINDNQEYYKVKGLGFSISQKIIFQTLVTRIEKNSNFTQFRESTLIATLILYGNSSNEYKQVMNAWHAVGVGGPYIEEGNIVGDFGVCDNGVYSLNNLHPAASITWSVDSFTNVMNQKRPKLTIVSGQNTESIIVKRTQTGLADTNGNYYYHNGPVTLTATISYGNETHTIQKSLFVNTPLPDIQYTTRQVSNASMNYIYKFYVNNVATNYLNWRIEANGSVYTATGQNYIEISLPTVRFYDVVVSVTDNGGCSEANYKTRTLKGVTIVSPILSHENPVTPNSVFYLKKETDEPDEGAVYNIEIWNEYGLIRSEEYDDAPEFMVSTEGLIPGVYFMRIYRNGEFLNTQKLVVK